VITATDDRAIRDLLERMRHAWAAGDGAAYAAEFTEDARYVAATGIRTVGREAIAQSHQKIFETFFKGTWLGRNYPAEFQPVSPDAVLVHASGAVLFPGEEERRVPPNGLLTMLVIRHGETWRVASFSNTPTGRARNARFFWRYLASRWPVFRAEARKARAHMLEEKHRNMGR
jgi:uncharacterized protein (TIGR02246 family)